MFQRKRKKYRLLGDSELIAIYKESRDNDSFSIIYERYGHLVMGTCMKYLKDEFEAEDLTSKIFEELGDKIIKHSIDYFKGWIYRLTKNECLMYLRKQQTKFLNQVQIDLLAEESEQIENIEPKLVLLENTLSELKTDQEQCLRLFYLENKSYHEVSSILKLDLNQVKSAIQNGKRNLKLILIQNDEFKQ
jgi:RNA polymerase sigma-70 factor (ECF subfamily)